MKVRDLPSLIFWFYFCLIAASRLADYVDQEECCLGITGKRVVCVWELGQVVNECTALVFFR